MNLLLILIFLNFHKPVDTSVQQTDYFIAMQYKGLSNCIYKVYITDSTLMCAKVNGYITISPSFGLGTVIPNDIRNDPEAYVNKKLEVKYPALLNNSENFLKADKQNFIIHKRDIKRAYHNPEKKWGMGPYPHNGRIMLQFVKVGNMYETELILIGNQDAEAILRKIK